MSGAAETVWDIPRNDVEACHRYWLEHEISGEDWRVMIRLQDDPAELIAAEKRWRKGARPRQGKGAV